MIGHPRVHHRLVDSTNRVARDLAGAGAPHGTLATADEQSAGRGRGDRTWVAPAGSSVLMSVVLRDQGHDPPLVPLTAGVALARVLEAWVTRVAIKWPNDLLIAGRKTAGILVEGRPQEGWTVLGIGVNVLTVPDDLPDDVRPTATSLAAAGGGRHPPDEVRDLLVAELDRWLARPGEAVLAAWRERDALRGSRVRWSAGQGTAAGVDERGALLVDTDGGRLALDAGEVHLIA
jgi:BirA family biotin operon repressor/biotin-[acetyl-CoA-carboxylase] ligase